MTVQQFANGESLREYLKNNFENLNWDDKLLIAKDIAQGLVFLHHNNKIHKNLHSRNVLIHEGRAVLTDLDWKRPLVAETSVSDTQTDRQPAFTDPQFFRNYTYKCSSKSDVYSYGVILWEISSGKKPFESFRSKEAIVIHIFKGHREKPVEGTQSQYVKLYEQCWDDDPDKRPEMRIVLDKLNHLNQFYATSLSIKNENPLNRLLEEAIAEQHLNFHNYNEFSGFENIDSKDLGSAYKTAWRNRGIKVTLKCFKNNNGDLDKQIIQLKNLQKINFHPNIIEFYGVTKDPNGNYYMVLQFTENTNLRGYLNSNFTMLNWPVKFCMAKEIAEGVRFLHKNNIIHCSLCPDNIMVYDRKMIITSFGISEHVSSQQMQAYIDPQCFRDPLYKCNEKSDIYSLGVILWEIFSGKSPENFDHIQEGEVPLRDIPPQYIKLYTLCRDIEPEKRPEIETVLNILNQMQ